MSLQFNSPQYGAFLLTLLTVYWLAPLPWRRWLLLVASYGFYATFDWRFTPLLAATTAVHYWVGHQLAGTSSPERRKTFLALAVLFTLGLLGFFKYSGWVDDLFSTLFGLKAGLPTLALPVGISYYTFHTLSYSIDVYRREQEPTDDLLGFALFVAYFPQLLSGPLTRAKRMLPQFSGLPKGMSAVQRREGIELILIGLFQKVALADALIPITNAAFIDTTRGPTPDRNWLMLVLSAMAGMAQLVLDLTGYSNIARGTSKLLGIELPHNFRQPLTRSRNLQDYWRRHHLTLMAWLRDYVFRPLRTRFGTSPPVAFALVVSVFTLSGMWHGTSAGWLVWGVVVGLGVATETVVLRTVDRRRRSRRRRPGPPPVSTSDSISDSVFPAGNPYAIPADDIEPWHWRVTAILRRVRSNLLCLLFLGAAAVFIRSSSLANASAYFGEVFRLRWVPTDSDDMGTLLYVAAAVIVVDHREAALERHEGTDDSPTLGRILLWSFLVLGLVVSSGTAGQRFVYLGF